MATSELVEIERSTWSSILYPDGTLKRVSDISHLIVAKEKARLQGYKRDRILGPATKSPRVQELLSQLKEAAIRKEDLE
ncbi:MAG: hypothetical protein ACTSYG_07310 [Candidatus Heimdallarchaeota archaeon]